MKKANNLQLEIQEKLLLQHSAWLISILKSSVTQCSTTTVIKAIIKYSSKYFFTNRKHTHGKNLYWKL